MGRISNTANPLCHAIHGAPADPSVMCSPWRRSQVARLQDRFAVVGRVGIENRRQSLGALAPTGGFSQPAAVALNRLGGHVTMVRSAKVLNRSSSYFSKLVR